MYVSNVDRACFFVRWLLLFEKRTQVQAKGHVDPLPLAAPEKAPPIVEPDASSSEDWLDLDSVSGRVDMICAGFTDKAWLRSCMRVHVFMCSCVCVCVTNCSVCLQRH